MSGVYSLGLCLWMGAGPWLIPVDRADIYSFPGMVEADERYREASNFDHWVKGQSQFYPAFSPRYFRLMSLSTQSVTCWHQLDRAWERHKDGFDYKENLEYLRARLGPDAYYKGVMPPTYQIPKR